MADVSRTVTPIVALDVRDAKAALALVDQLGASCRFYKIGSELFTSEGPSIVKAVMGRGASVFLDLKFHDIPNTVQGAVRSAALLGVRILTVHASGGKAMMEAAVRGAKEAAMILASDVPADAVSTGVWDKMTKPQVEIFAVTVLTSFDAAGLGESWGRSVADMRGEVLRLARLTADAGLQGIVCSGEEAAAVREALGGRLATLVPGIRMAGGAAQDQARVVTPGEAARAGARYIILGRAVTGAKSPKDAMAEVLSDLP
jgi:orotidine-5'-phosphate decarboxylase